MGSPGCARPAGHGFAQEVPSDDWLGVWTANRNVTLGVERGWRIRSALITHRDLSITRLMEDDCPNLWYHGSYVAAACWDGCVYIDCSTKAVVGWAMDDNYKTPLIGKAIAMAAGNHQFADDAIFHSDRGSNDTSNQFVQTLKKHGLRHSVGRTGICYDNAMAETFFAALKNQRVHRTISDPADTSTAIVPDTSNSAKIHDVAT